MYQILVTEVTPGKYEVRVDTWTSQVNKPNTVNRRFRFHMRTLLGQAEAKIEAARYANALKKKCPRCKGQGYLDAFLHVAHGVCFKCGGDGQVERK